MGCKQIIQITSPCITVGSTYCKDGKLDLVSELTLDHNLHIYIRWSCVGYFHSHTNCHQREHHKRELRDSESSHSPRLVWCLRSCTYSAFEVKVIVQCMLTSVGYYLNLLTSLRVQKLQSFEYRNLPQHFSVN